MNRITILGSGTSTGVPILGCNCDVCNSNDPRNRRLRTSALIEFSSGKNILIDATPDLRTQLLRTKIKSLDGVLITHDHADHILGMDDLRPFTWNRSSVLKVYADALAAGNLRRKFTYIFERDTYFADKKILGGGIPMLDLDVVTPGETMIAEEKFHLSSLPHGHEETLCFVQGKCGYIVDCREIPEATLKLFHDARLEVLVIDCLRHAPHQTHLHLDKTLEYIQRIGPKTAILTHMSHEFDYVKLTSELRARGMKNVLPAVDGMSFLYSSP